MMKLSVDITKDDYKAFRRFVRYRVQQTHWLYIGLLAFLEIATWRGHEPDTELLNKVSSAIAIPIVFFGFIGIVLLLHLGLRKMRGVTFQNQCGPHTFEILNGTLIETNDSGRIETKLNQIKKIYETSKHIFVLKKNAIAHIIPKRELAEDYPADVVIAKLREEA